MDYSDTLTSIIKSITPVKYVFSNQSKKFDNFFLYKNLDHFVKTFDKNYRSKSAFYQELPKKDSDNNNYKYIYEKDIERTFNLLEKMKNTNKYLPRSLLNRNRNKNNNKLYTNNIKSIKNDKNNEKKNKNKNKEKEEKHNENFFHNITLDPGRYDPKYTLIFKRMINIYFGKERKFCSKMGELNNINENNKANKNNKDNKDKDKTPKYKKLTIKNDNDDDESSKKLILSNDINLSSDKLNYFKRNRINSNYKINNNLKKIFPSPIFNFNSPRALSPQNKKSSFISLNKKDNNNNKKKIFSAKLKNKFLYLENKNKEDKKLLMKRCLSNMRLNNNMLSFDKMRGRGKNFFKVKEEIKSQYSPKYETIRPRMRVKEFTIKKSLQSFKRYAVGKIIRNYYCPPSYFIFDINNNKNVDEIYHHIIK